MNIGNTDSIIIIARLSEIMLITMDSKRNCLNKLILKAPTTFRIPTSLALVAERAVDKFMKLIMATNNIKIAIIEKV